MRIAGGFAVAMGAIVVLAAIVFGGWQLGWWFKTQNTNRADVLYQQSYSAQNGAEQHLGQQISELATVSTEMTDPSVSAEQKTALAGQRHAMLDQACMTAQSITHPTPAHESWRSENCGSN